MSKFDNSKLTFFWTTIIFVYMKYISLPITATLNEFFMLWRVRKKVSIPLKAPKAPLFEYVN